MTKYALIIETMESTRFKKFVEWSEKDFLDDYYRQGCWYYDTLDEFDTYEEAKAEFDKRNAADAILRHGSAGYFLEYEVLGVEKRVYDDKGNDFDNMEMLDTKASNGWIPPVKA